MPRRRPGRVVIRLVPGQHDLQVRFTGNQPAAGDLPAQGTGTALVPLVEHHTGVFFGSRAVELCVLRWAAPHGIRVTGTRFLTDRRYDSGGVLNIAVRELLHPPWPKDHPVKSRLDALSADPFLAARFAGRDPAAGYTPGPATPRKTRPRRSISTSTPSSDATPGRPGDQMDHRRWRHARPGPVSRTDGDPLTRSLRHAVLPLPLPPDTPQRFQRPD